MLSVLLWCVTAVHMFKWFKNREPSTKCHYLCLNLTFPSTGPLTPDHITFTLQQLCWLPVKYCICFKVPLLVYKSLYGLSNLLHHHTSSDSHLSRLHTVCDRAFSVVGPCLFKALPHSIQHQLIHLNLNF